MGSRDPGTGRPRGIQGRAIIIIIIIIITIITIIIIIVVGTIIIIGSRKGWVDACDLDLALAR